MTDDAAASSEIGFFGAGMRFLQLQRERRQRHLLETQVEDQRRRLQQGSAVAACPPVSCVDLKVSIPTTTMSGKGMSVSVEMDNERTDTWIAGIRIDDEPNSSHPFCPYILSEDQMLRIANDALPASVAHCRWSRLYSLARDGDSFDAFMHLVEGAARTLLVLKTTRGDVFGGFADSPWVSQHHSLAVGACFYGSAQAFLYRFTEGQLRVFKWTGLNRYIQLCDVGHKMLAFGGGGDKGSFGLCIEQDFQRGSTGTCDTFDNEPLCDEENFDVLNVELWAFLTGQF